MINHFSYGLKDIIYFDGIKKICLLFKLTFYENIPLFQI